MTSNFAKSAGQFCLIIRKVRPILGEFIFLLVGYVQDFRTATNMMSNFAKRARQA